MFKAIIQNKINKSLILYASEKSIINAWERDFLLNIWRKRKLTERQSYILFPLKQKILKKVKHEEEH